MPPAAQASSIVKQALVTGGGGGIGLAIAERLVADGYRVGLLDMAFPVPPAAPDAILPFVCDVTDPQAVEDVLAAFGETPDLLVNAAATIRFGALLDQSLADFRRVIDVNVMGVFVPCRLVAPAMAAKGGGVIVNISSINAINPGPATGAYPCSKAAVSRLTEHLALELGPQGVRVNGVAPGFIDCGMSASVYADPTIRAARSAGVPVQRLGVAQDIAAAVAFLGSDAASYINGHQLVVDGAVSRSLLAQLRREA